MMKERYGFACSTQSIRALDYYVEAVDILLSAQAGALEKLQLAIVEDRNFALAHITLAGTYQMMSRTFDAEASLNTGLALANQTSEWEQSHIRVATLIFNSSTAVAHQGALDHLKKYPRDALIANSICGAFGLIGFSGRAGREQENLRFMESLTRHYGDDWWFNSQFAFAICEAGDPFRAQPIIELALAANPNNADAIHNSAHIHYESGESRTGLAALERWRTSYDRGGILYGHIAWHCALWHLEFGEFDRAMEIFDKDINPDINLSPPINTVTDCIGFLLRAEIAGARITTEQWQSASDLGRLYFPEPGLSFVDAHLSIAYARTSQPARLSTYLSQHNGVCSDKVTAIARAAKAYSNCHWARVVDSLSPIMSDHERLGGSRAQRDFIEVLLANSLVNLHRREDAIDGISARRHRVNGSIFGLT